MSVRYDKLILRNERLVIAPPDFTDRHELVLVRRQIGGTEVTLIFEAYAIGEPLPWKEAIAAADARKAYGVVPIQAATHEEATLLSDRSLWPSAPVEYFPDIRENWSSWTRTTDAEDPEECAWAVYFDYGDSYRVRQSDHYHARGVAPSQYLDLGEVA
jgi:hypothetical protein